MAGATGGGLRAVLLCAVLAIGSSSSSNNTAEDIQRACTVYCHGDILEAVQLSGIFNDSKTFVDMPMKEDPEVVNAAFQALGIGKYKYVLYL
jgi:alpha,alpha-trehalase